MNLFAVAALAGWGLMQMKLSEKLLDCNTVVMNGDVEYQRPVFEDLICTCQLPADAAQFFETLSRDGKAATTLQSQFLANNKSAMRLNARYHLTKRT